VRPHRECYGREHDPSSRAPVAGTMTINPGDGSRSRSPRVEIQGPTPRRYMSISSHDLGPVTSRGNGHLANRGSALEHRVEVTAASVDAIFIAPVGQHGDKILLGRIKVSGEVRPHPVRVAQQVI
jgi:hypothetical protein